MNKRLQVVFLVFLVFLDHVQTRRVPLNGAAGTQVLYEVQVRTANACHPGVGSPEQVEACNNKIAPKIIYKANATCPIINDLLSIKLGTLDDMMEMTTEYGQGVTLSYIKKKVGATAVWLMPLFPNNDRWNLPDACDNLGSPYAVRDFFHLRGTLSRKCILSGQDEESPIPCYANTELDELIAQASFLGLKVFLDLPFNHFGHNYWFYDLMNVTTIRDRVASGQSLDELWNFDATFEQALLYPSIRENPAQMRNSWGDPDLNAFLQKCPTLNGLDLVRGFNMWKVAFDHERQNFNCNNNTFLEQNLFGFYLGSNSWDPAAKYGDFFTNNWVDVKFLFHRMDNVAHQWEFARVREYLFRVMNYWVSRGVSGFRLDHTTDPNSGMSADEWLYITSKVNYYAARRGQDRPIYLAEEFHDQMPMGQVVDIETEGYVGDMCGRSNPSKDVSFVEKVTQNTLRFNYDTFVMTALETHDEKRLLDGTGFDIWSGFGFWAIGSTLWSTPMMLMGQEFGEPWGLGFKRNDYLRSRFVGTNNYNPNGAQLVELYGKVNKARTDPANRALQSQSWYFLRTKQDNSIDQRIFAKMKWMDTNVVFVFHNLWNLPSVEQTYYIPPEIGSAAMISDTQKYILWDILANAPVGNCITGAELKWSFYVKLQSSVLQWLRLQSC